MTCRGAAKGWDCGAAGLGVLRDRFLSAGCRQGSPQSLVLWNLILDEALGPLVVEWQRKGCSVSRPSLTADPQGPAPWRCGGTRRTGLLS